jgi:DNA-binding MarR family transcriptional regulator
LQEDLQDVLGNNERDAHLDTDYINLNDSLSETPVLSFPEIEVLLLFDSDDAKLRKFSFGFQGIRRRLDIHQQTLTIALKRLVKKGIIAKNNDNEYFLTNHGENLISNLFERDGGQAKYTYDSEQNKFPSCEIDMKVNLKMGEHKKIAKKLKGKWFSHYRYVGSSIGEDKSIMEWITDDANYSARVCTNMDGNIRITVSALKFCEGAQLREETNKVSLFIEKNLREIFAVSPIYQSKIESTKSQPSLDPIYLNKWMEEIYQSQMQQNYS